MEKLIAMVICTILVVALVGCSTSKDGNYPATIMVNGTNFYSIQPGEANLHGQELGEG